MSSEFGNDESYPDHWTYLRAENDLRERETSYAEELESQRKKDQVRDDAEEERREWAAKFWAAISWLFWASITSAVIFSISSFFGAPILGIIAVVWWLWFVRPR